MNKERPAYSLIFAFIMMTLIMVVASTSIQDTRNKLQLFNDLEANSQARLAAESAAELGIVDLKNSNFNSGTEETDVFCLETDGRSDCQSDGSYTVYSEAGENDYEADGYYYLPIPGTGNAAPTEDCSIVDDDLEADHSCNWNKIKPGDSVTIPLYYDDGTGALSFPDTINLSEFYLRMRTPCEDGSITASCSTGDRYEISSATNQYEISSNPVVILWEFAGETSSGSTSWIPSDTTLSSTIRNYFTNTEITEAFIQSSPLSLTSFDSVVLAGISSGTYTGYNEIYNFFRQSGFTDLYFSMNIVNVLEDTTGDPIPYLEYQIVTLSNTGYPIVSPSAQVIGEGYYDSGEFTYYFPYVVSTNNTDTVTTLFTLSN